MGHVLLGRRDIIPNHIRIGFGPSTVRSGTESDHRGVVRDAQFEVKGAGDRRQQETLVDNSRLSQELLVAVVLVGGVGVDGECIG